MAGSSFDGELLKKDLEKTREICKQHGCPLEFIFKDVSTVTNNPKRLMEAAEIAMKVVVF